MCFVLLHDHDMRLNAHPKPQLSQAGDADLPPPAPIPSDDPRLIVQARTPPPLHHAPSISSQDLFKLSPIAALKLLSGGIEALVRVTGDIPPTPPPTSPTIPHMRGFAKEKADIVRVHSERSLLRLHQQAQAEEQAAAAQATAASTTSPFFPPQAQAPIDGVKLRHTPMPPPPPPTATPEPYLVIGANSQPLNLQHSAITRKFYSKAPPPISIEDYLLKNAPLLTAVYLATSLYIFRLAVDERAIPVTRRNCHRLLLAGLRVAMKALEDLSYPHAKVARVGGVSEVELARLEISFCFLAGFELVVGEETLRRHWEDLRDGQAMSSGSSSSARRGGGMTEIGRVPVLKLEHRRRGFQSTARRLRGTRKKSKEIGNLSRVMKRTSLYYYYFASGRNKYRASIRITMETVLVCWPIRQDPIFIRNTTPYCTRLRSGNGRGRRSGTEPISQGLLGGLSRAFSFA
ncbi:cyclin-domain-containing protein [Apiospora phragmitis]|uniref:Cyclin-domain-containing protein n=1 Tax=Apiospora phragmitis TaxID=2905665 RepID=A0ABR1TQN0_9PEZI